MERLRQQAARELHAILDWWVLHTIDERRKGFYGRIDGHGALHPDADKGVILNARVLWAFSAAARATGLASYAAIADRAFAYFTRYFLDKKDGGVFWMLDCRGNPVQPKKQGYAQAFAIYGLSEYYLLTRKKAALKHALGIFALLERHNRDRDRGGYIEAFTRDWSPLDDLRLSDRDANEAKTMNTHLHLLEAYTVLHKASGRRDVREALHALAGLFLEKFIDPDTAHLRLFFDENWVLKSSRISFGHDIEAAWLLCEAAETLGDEALSEQCRAAAVRIARRTLETGVDPADGGLWNEAGPDGLTDRNKDWWPQAEAVAGFLYVWKITGDDTFARAAQRSWDFIENHLIDRRNGEWYWALNADGTPDTENDKAGPWKCPYHNGRACILAGSLR